MNDDQFVSAAHRDDSDAADERSTVHEAGHDTFELDVPPAFAIRDAATANWLVRRVVEAREHAVRAKAWAATKVRRVEREESQLLYLFGQQLQTWVRAELERLRHRRRTVFLPDGQVGYRRNPGRMLVEDEAAALAWAREHCPEAVRVTLSLNKTVLRETAERGNVIIPGARTVEPADEFFLR